MIGTSCIGAHSAPLQPYKFRPSVGTWLLTPFEQDDDQAEQHEIPEDVHLFVNGEQKRTQAYTEELSSEDSTSATADYLQNEESDTEDVAVNGFAASDFVSCLLEDVVEDYSEEAVFEIFHGMEAPQIFDVDSDLDEDFLNIRIERQDVEDVATEAAKQLSEEIVWTAPIESPLGTTMPEWHEYLDDLAPEEHAPQQVECGNFETEDTSSKDELSSICASLRDLLVDAMEDGRLEQAVREHHAEVARGELRDALMDSALNGKLERVMLEVRAQLEQEAQQAAFDADSHVPMAPVSPKEGRPSRGRFHHGPRGIAAEAPAEQKEQTPQFAVSITAPAAKPQGPQRARSYTVAQTNAVAPSAPATPRPTRSGSRPGSAANTKPSSENSVEVAVSAPLSPRPPAQPSGVRRPGRSSALSTTMDEEMTIKPVPPQAPKKPQTPRPQSAAHAATVVNNWDQPSLPPKQHMQSSRKSHQKVEVHKGSLSARGSGPTALEIDLGLVPGSAQTVAPSAPLPTSIASPRLFKNAIGTGLLPVIPSTKNPGGPVAWNMSPDASTERWGSRKHRLIF